MTLNLNIGDLMRAVDKFTPTGDPPEDALLFEKFKVQLESLAGDESITAAMEPIPAAGAQKVGSLTLPGVLK